MGEDWIAGADGTSKVAGKKFIGEEHQKSGGEER